MLKNNRRDFLKAIGAAGAASAIPASISRALALPARRVTGTIKDVKHIVILMQENRSFDHYFGTMSGVRGFGDRHTVPLPGDRTVWEQHNGVRVRPPFWLDTRKTNGMRLPSTPHTFPDAQAAWNQGRFGHWPRFKTDYAMGYYKRADLPFQFALADAFTLCDAYHCSVATCTDPNRIVFWSGSNFDPNERARGINCRDDKAEVYNVRCQVSGTMPEPGYTYGGNAFEWDTIPDVLERHGIDWRIYQDPNDNASGLFHGCLAFKSFRECKPGSSRYERGMRHWSIDQFAQDVKNGTLPTVSWLLPEAEWSEHPSASTPIQGAEYVARVLDALTANPDIWASTVFLQTYDENDGLFDHVPPPAPPSFRKDGALAGKASFDLAGEYFDDHEGKWTMPEDDVTGNIRPWGLGARVPMFVVSPWSKGGWVNSETFDHTSLGRFLEKRFDIVIPAISPWHRRMCGDLTSCFDFGSDEDTSFPALPDATGSRNALVEHVKRPNVTPWWSPKEIHQEKGLRRSRPLPYALHVNARMQDGAVVLDFVNDGTTGATFHVYDKRHLDHIPRRYCVESGKRVEDRWDAAETGDCDLYILGPNGFMRAFTVRSGTRLPIVTTAYDKARRDIVLNVEHLGEAPLNLVLGNDLYGINSVQRPSLRPRSKTRLLWTARKSHGWYDFSVEADGLKIRYAGRIEDGKPTVSDPLMFT